MLFVTVSVLQLREVVHPDLLSPIIRPQEPHPDLLGSLLQESGRTHAQRMAMSLVSCFAFVGVCVLLWGRVGGGAGVIGVFVSWRKVLVYFMSCVGFFALHVCVLSLCLCLLSVFCVSPPQPSCPPRLVGKNRACPVPAL